MTEDTGILRTAKLFREDSQFPMIFYVEARDNDGQEMGSHRTRARMVINLITDQQRHSLFFSDATPNELRSHSAALAELFSEKTGGLISGIERFSKRKFLNENGTILENPAATDVWFYLIDPKTEKILSRNASVVQETLLEPTARSEVIFAASSKTRATAEGIYAPIEMKQQVHKVCFFVRRPFYFRWVCFKGTLLRLC